MGGPRLVKRWPVEGCQPTEGCREGWPLPVPPALWSQDYLCLYMTVPTGTGVPARTSLRSRELHCSHLGTLMHLPLWRLTAAPASKSSGWNRSWGLPDGAPGGAQSTHSEPSLCFTKGPHRGLERTQAIASVAAPLLREPASPGRARAWVCQAHIPGSQGPLHLERGSSSVRELPGRERP